MSREFRAGDTIRMLATCSDCFKGELYKLVEYRGRLHAKGQSFPRTMCSCQENWKLIKEATPMSKYDELKAKIEALDNGWTKEADDIRIEMAQQTNFTIHDDSTSGFGHLKVVKDMSGKQTNSPIFHWVSQCSKLTAFKNALLWLLDHSNIKKDDKQEKIKELEERIRITDIRHKENIEDLRRQIDELK